MWSSPKSVNCGQWPAASGDDRAPKKGQSTKTSSLPHLMPPVHLSPLPESHTTSCPEPNSPAPANSPPLIPYPPAGQKMLRCSSWPFADKGFDLDLLRGPSRPFVDKGFALDLLRGPPRPPRKKVLPSTFFVVLSGPSRTKVLPLTFFAPLRGQKGILSRSTPNERPPTENQKTSPTDHPFADLTSMPTYNILVHSKMS